MEVKGGGILRLGESDLEGSHTVRRPREIDPTNFSIETVREAIIAT